MLYSLLWYTWSIVLYSIRWCTARYVIHYIVTYVNLFIALEYFWLTEKSYRFKMIHTFLK